MLLLLSVLLFGSAAPGWGEERGEGGIRFREVSEAWGLAFRHHHGGTGEFYMIETMGSGVVVFDYDSDGDEDVYFVESGEVPVGGVGTGGGRSALYRNEGGGRFVEVTERAGAGLGIYGMGGTAGDVDGDGDVDLYVTAFGPNRLLRNEGDGRFVDVTDAAGVGDPLWGASAALADTDRDGDLDLYVTNYVDFSFDNNPLCGLPSRGLRSYCHPDVYAGLPDRFFRNRGDGVFEEATAAAGFGEARGKGLGVVFGDLDRDGWIDLYVANDMTANFLFRNRRDGTFEDIALAAGAAFSDRGDVEAGMGVELGDLDGNGYADLIVTHLDMQMTALYSNTGLGVFVDRRYPSQLAEPSFFNVGFGVVLGDFGQDGAVDIAFANGHIIHNAEEWGTGTSYRQRNVVMENLGDGRFREATEAGLEVVRASRGLAAGDLDGDGDLELVVSNSDDLAEVYENVSEGAGGWLLVEPAGRQPVGAWVEVEAGGRTQSRETRTASSYLSQNAFAVHFGLGAAPRVDRLRITWPDGRRQELRGLPVNRKVRVGG